MRFIFAYMNSLIHVAFVFSMEVWPGFEAAISIYRAGVMVQMDVSHKVLNVRNILDEINAIFNESRNPQAEVERRLNNVIVLTR